MIQEAPVIAGGMNDRIGMLVVDLTTANNIPDWLNATHKLAAAANGHVIVYLKEIGGEAPVIETMRTDLQDKLDVAKANRPEERSEELEFWTEYVKDLESQIHHIVTTWGSRAIYQVFVKRWDAIYLQFRNTINAMSLMVEGRMARVFDTQRKQMRYVTLSPDPTIRAIMVGAMGIRDFGQEAITSHIEIMRGIGELDRHMFTAAGELDALFAEIFGDLSVYRDNFLQYLALHRADEKGKLEEVLQQREMMRGGSE